MALPVVPRFRSSAKTMLGEPISARAIAIYNSLLKAQTVRGRDGHVIQALPIDRLREILSKPPNP